LLRNLGYAYLTAVRLFILKSPVASTVNTVFDRRGFEYLIDVCGIYDILVVVRRTPRPFILNNLFLHFLNQFVKVKQVV
jgi:hypothetical protein